jgi:hypothetical protein
LIVLSASDRPDISWWRSLNIVFILPFVEAKGDPRARMTITPDAPRGQFRQVCPGDRTSPGHGVAIGVATLMDNNGFYPTIWKIRLRDAALWSLSQSMDNGLTNS